MATDGLLDFDVQGNLKELIQGYPERAFPVIKSAFSKSVFKIHAEVLANTRTNLKRRTGALGKSLKAIVVGNNLETLEGIVYSDIVYAPIHEYGGVITAKNAYRGVPGGPYLNIPLPPNQTGAGVTRKSAKQVFDDGGFIYQSKRGNWLVAQNKNGTLQNMFVLKKQVTIEPRLGIRKAIDDETPHMMEGMQQAVLGAWA